jgi:outer membrane protein TolC
MTELKILLLLILVPAFAMAQDTESFTLKEAQEYALENSYATRTAELEIDKAKRDVKATTAIGLPQINGAVNYQNNVQIPTQLLPGDFFGQPGTFVPVQFGVEHNLTANVTVDQLLFDGSFFVGLQASKTYKELSQIQLSRSKNETRFQVAQAYYNALAAKENAEILSESVGLLKKSLSDTKAMYENGFVEEQDVDQLELSVSDIENQIRYAEQQSKIARDLLKFQMGMEVGNEIQLEDDIDQLTEGDLSSLTNSDFAAEKNDRYRIARTSMELQMLNAKREKALALPRLSAFYQYQQQGQSQEFNFLESSDPWFPSQVIGVRLNVPIFTSFRRYNIVQKAELDVKVAELQMEQTEQSLKMEYERAKSDYLYALENFQTSEKNMELARKIFDKTQTKYQEGISDSFELTQAENQLLDKQGAYINAVVRLLNAKASYNKILNQ